MSVIAEDDEIIVDGYLREHYHLVQLPKDLWKLIYCFYHLTFEIMKFSQFYKSKTGWELTNDNKCAKRLRSISGYRWIVGNEDNAIYGGCHCWRVFVDNPDKVLIVYGVSEAYRIYDDRQHDIKWGRTKIIGIGYKDLWSSWSEWTDARLGLKPSARMNGDHDYYETNQKYQCQHFNPDGDESKICIDILLNCDKGFVEFAVVVVLSMEFAAYLHN